MDLFLSTRVNAFQEKAGGYLALLGYRYMNLCVKAEVAALLPVAVDVMGTNMHLEDVALIATPDNYHFAIYPKVEEKNYIQQIVNGILFSHPEFKLSMKKTQILNEEKQYLEYEMPEVDKNRRDLLNEAVKTLYDEAKVNIEKLYAEEKAALVDLRKAFNDEDIKKTDEELDKNHDLVLDKILNIKIQKLDEVEAGYQRYLTMHPDEEAGGSKKHDVTKSMKMNEEGN